MSNSIYKILCYIIINDELPGNVVLERILPKLLSAFSSSVEALLWLNSNVIKAFSLGSLSAVAASS